MKFLEGVIKRAYKCIELFLSLNIVFYRPRELQSRGMVCGRCVKHEVFMVQCQET